MIASTSALSALKRPSRNASTPVYQAINGMSRSSKPHIPCHLRRSVLRRLRLNPPGSVGGRGTGACPDDKGFIFTTSQTPERRDHVSRCELANSPELSV